MGGQSPPSCSPIILFYGSGLHPVEAFSRMYGKYPAASGVIIIVTLISGVGIISALPIIAILLNASQTLPPLPLNMTWIHFSVITVHDSRKCIRTDGERIRIAQPAPAI